MRRDFPPETGRSHHVYTKSIYKFVIFPSRVEYERMRQLMSYYLTDPPVLPFSHFLRSWNVKSMGFEKALLHYRTSPPPESCSVSNNPPEVRRLVDISAWCLMPTHVHLIVKQVTDNGLKLYMGRILNSFSQYFNRRHNRKGPLWQGRYGCTTIYTTEYLDDRTNYVIHNPVKDRIVTNISEWPYCSVNTSLM